MSNEIDPNDVIEDEINTSDVVEDTAPPSNALGNAMSTPEIAIRGAAAAFPGVNQFVGLSGALFDSSDEDFGERYNKSQAEWKASQNAAKEANSYLFAGGEIAMDIATTAALPGVGLTAGLAKTFGMSMVRQIGDKPDSGSLGEYVNNAALNTAGSLVIGKGLEKVAGATGKAFKSQAIKTAVDWVTDGTDGLMKKLDDHVFKYYNSGNAIKTAKSSLEATGDYLDDVGKIIVSGKPLIGPNSTQESIKKGSIRALQEIGKGMDDVLKGTDVPINMSALESKLIEATGKAELVSNELVIDSVKNDAVKSLYDTIIQPLKGADGIDVPTAMRGAYKKYDLNQLHTLKKELAGKVSWENADSSVKSNYIMRQVHAIDDFIEEHLEKNVKEGVEKWSGLKKDYRNVHKLGELTEAKGPVGIGGGIMKKFRTTISIGSGAATAYVGSSLLHLPPQVAVGAGVAVQQAIAHGEVLQPQLADKLMRVSKHLIELPNSKISQGIMAAGQGTSSIFNDKVMGAASRLMLQDNPLPRTNADLINRSDDVLLTVQEVDPKAADTLREAISNKDETTMQNVMEMLSKHPNAKGLIQPGVGWNGKVTDPNDIKMLNSQVDSMDISHKQKLQHKKELNTNGKIPVLQKEVPYFIDHKARNKSNPSY